MPRRKAKRNTTYRERYNALSALEVYMRDKIQKLWTLIALQLKTVEQMLMVSIMLELDHDGDFFIILFMLWNHCVHSCNFFQQLDNLLMEITRFRVVRLWELYHLLEFPAMFYRVNKR